MDPRIRVAAASAIAMLATIANVDPDAAAHPLLSQVTWTIDVAPIVNRRCVACHRPGGFAPMSLATYAEARSWAKAIRQEVLERRMPPWPAAKGFGDFQNDRSLTAREVEVLTAWADSDAPLGPAHSSPISDSDRTVRRTPALLLHAPPVRVQNPVERLELTTGLESTRWIAGWEFTPGAAAFVQHATLKIAPDTVIGTWVPGESVMMYPAGVARRLPPRSRLLLEVHYAKATEPALVRSTVGLHQVKRPQHEVERHFFGCGAATIEQPIDVLSVSPLSREVGGSIEVVARRPDGTVEPLVLVLEYQPRYPLTYRYRKAVRLPRGTLLDVRSPGEGCGVYLEVVNLHSGSRTGIVKGAVSTVPSR